MERVVQVEANRFTRRVFLLFSVTSSKKTKMEKSQKSGFLVSKTKNRSIEIHNRDKSKKKKLNPFNSELS